MVSERYLKSKRAAARLRYRRDVHFAAHDKNWRTVSDYVSKYARTVASAAAYSTCRKLNANLVVAVLA